MKKVLFLYTLLLPFSLTAQITITVSDMPSANDSLRYSTTNLDSISAAIYTETGANQSWDFTHLEARRQSVAEYKRSLATPYALFFLGFNKYGTEVFDTLGFGQFALTDVYDFYQRKDNAFEAEGRGFRVGGVPVPAYFSDEDEIYQFPLRYEDRDSSTFTFSADVQDIITYKSTGYRINTVDGFGEISTPYGTFDCIRVVSDVVAFDTIQVQDFDVGFRTNRREYKWLAKGEAFPILEISGLFDVLGNGDFTPTTVRQG